MGQRQRWRNYSVAVVNDKRRYGDASRPVTSVSTSGLYRIGQSAIIDGVPANNNEPINSWPNRPKNRPARLPLDRRPARPAPVTGPTTRPARPARVTGLTTGVTGASGLRVIGADGMATCSVNSAKPSMTLISKPILYSSVMPNRND